MKKLLAFGASFCALAVAAHAADLAPVTMDTSKWFVHLGAAGVFFDSHANSTTPALLPAQDVIVTDNITPTIEIGRYVTDRVSFSLSAGLPPTNELWGTFNGNKIAKIGTVNYGSVIAAAQYHFGIDSRFKPYVGAGVGYNITLSASPSAPFPSLSVDNSIGAVLQAGTEFDFSQNVGVFADVKKMFASTTAHAGPATVNERLNPWIVSAGVNFRF